MRSEEVFEVLVGAIFAREADLGHSSDGNADKDSSKDAEANDDVGAQHRV